MEEEAFMLRQMELSYNDTTYNNENPSKLTFEQKQGYFKLLNTNEMKQLYYMYKRDFDLFEYDPKIYD